MEALTRLVSDSLARHGLDRPVDPRRLQWSRWFRCDSPHSLLVVPSKPGIFALAEEIMELGAGNTHVGTAALACPERPIAERRGVERGSQAERSSAAFSASAPFSAGAAFLGGAALQRCEPQPQRDAALAAEVPSKRMLAVIQFSEDDNMAFVLDRMFTHVNPMRARLHAGNCFVRFVVVEDQSQRRSICAALNQWMRNSAEKASGLPSDFSSSLELSLESMGRTPSQAPWPWGMKADAKQDAKAEPAAVRSHPDSGAASNLHCPQPFPNGF